MSEAAYSSLGTALENRIDRQFSRLGDRAALILYVTAGHPDPQTSRNITPVVAELADIIEIGIPFSDPVADGPIVQASTQTALRNGTRIDDCIELAAHTRAQSDAPIVFLTYYNPVLHHGLDRFARASRDAGVDGVICADLPVEESVGLHKALEAEGIHLIPMIAPTSTDDRMRLSCDAAGGFVYCVSRTGVTGLQESLNHDLPEFLARVRRCTDLPRAVGFGVSKPEHAQLVASVAEGVIIGSALVDIMSTVESEELEFRVRAFVESIREGMYAGG